MCCLFISHLFVVYLFFPVGIGSSLCPLAITIENKHFIWGAPECNGKELFFCLLYSSCDIFCLLLLDGVTFSVCPWHFFRYWMKHKSEEE